MDGKIGLSATPLVFGVSYDLFFFFFMFSQKIFQNNIQNGTSSFGQKAVKNNKFPKKFRFEILTHKNIVQT